MNTEDVSVLMLNYNHGHYLPRAINAVLTQSVRPREFIIIDDASTDDSISVLEKFARQDPVIRVVRCERNQGVVPNNNRGLRMCTSEYIIAAAADDYLLPGMIERSMAVLRQNPQVGMSCGYWRLLIESTGETRQYKTDWGTAPAYMSPAQLAESIHGGTLPTPSAIFRREALLRAGAYHNELHWHADWFAAMVVAFRDGICYVPDALAVQTVREASHLHAGIRDTAAQRAVMTEALKLLLSPEYQDVLPFFQSSGIMTSYGRHLVEAAAGLPQRWSPAVLGLISGMELEVYASLLDDDNPEVRSLARFLLGPMWKWRMQEMAHLRSVSERLNRFMTTPMGRLWRRMGRLKGVIRRLAG
ncbi:MAG TPA: glycosyltransferase family A protein [Gemmataceae bacterium]|jgi:glycosyltransferase involved in cell wall biosynthesis|nr:glycosyltransferase family A protein [Gemmataceae bacterium]